ncbi:type II toxin-antitoxin system RelE/ParE family toxin [Brumimicrobium glaciale]|uniref:Type II toxin-antitoxin system RelE/ParE family toxin n=1 Tax=Brumimicrobium glaciale TaxID=200475 RepID=A0A4Q4KPV3_9FLAO|nr:type II toxin-antitoxin system RelE/ParE family toxin [Brumimicrobium glaciale]RYM35417.1 type II toxin-antitoxin system RelE/ParE family toxin [Brumimicrobium glaciale]
MKVFNVKVLDEASIDLDEGFEYYSDINPELGERFINLVYSALKDLEKNPFYQIRYHNFRMKVVRKFPYVIHYILDEKRQIVFVYGIRNSFQDPDKYPKE